MKILIIDDDLDYASLIAAFLHNQGHEAIVVDYSREAPDVYLEERPDLVLMDIIMPFMDGIEASEEIIGLDPDARLLCDCRHGREQGRQEGEEPNPGAGCEIQTE